MESAKSKRNPSSTIHATRILLVDDHPIFRYGLNAMVSSQADFDVCGEAASLSEAMQLFRQTQPEVVITDISLPDGSGIELVKQLVALDPVLKILVCSMHDETLFAERALRAGAKGYISKEDSPDRLVEAVRRVAENRVYLSDKMTDRLIGQRVGVHQKADLPAIETLSDRELEVYEQIGRGETTRQIAQKLHLSQKTVESYRENIKAKLNLANATELTQHVVKWVLE